MGWMAELTGKTPHKGQVVVTDASGVSTTFVDMEKAEEACGKLKGKLAYFRGAFFERGTSRPERKAAAAEAKAKEAEAKVEETSAAPKRRRRGADDGSADD